jgi:hypothetical protein
LIQDRKNACKGCVCYECKQSEKQGNMYGCNRCQRCGGMRLMFCDKSQPQEDKEPLGGLRL